jgi:hypothetical protein
MTLISHLSLEDFVNLQDKIIEQIHGCTTFEAAAQKYMSILYDELTETIVLARLFVTIPFKELPEPNREFVMNLAASADISERINGQTLVLSLLGTRGVDPQWNDRRNSKGHVGIPLVSSDFIERIPMMSRLLKQLGAGIDWIESDDTALVARTIGRMSGIFHVRDAKIEVDNKGRKIIAAQDFVEEHGVKTVFGIGGGYLGSSLFFTTIVFLREYLDKEKAERFMLQANKFKTATLGFIEEGKILT